MAKVNKRVYKLLFYFFGFVVLFIVVADFFSPLLLNLIHRTASFLGYNDSREIKVDELTGLRYVDYGKERSKIVGIQYNPVTISRDALDHFNAFRKSGDKAQLIIGLRNVDWLVGNLSKNYKGVYVWLYNFDYPRYGLKAPWYSGMAQGLGISALVNAYILTGEQKYLDTATKAFVSFTKDIEDGGVRYPCQGGYWYEEYCSANIQPPLTLNGFMFALIGLYDYYKVTKRNDVYVAFDLGVKCLVNNLESYNIANIWSYHNSLGVAASRDYHSLHVKLLYLMYEITGNVIFSEYASRWSRGLHLPKSIELIIARNRTNNILLCLISTISLFLVGIFDFFLVRPILNLKKGND